MSTFGGSTVCVRVLTYHVEEGGASAEQQLQQCIEEGDGHREVVSDDGPKRLQNLAGEKD